MNKPSNTPRKNVAEQVAEQVAEHATSAGAEAPEVPSYYKHHVFVCLNERGAGEASCANHNAQAAYDHCKSKVKKLGLAGPGGVRMNKAGCLDRCAGGPVAVVYPEAIWYTFVDHSDLDEIIEEHLVNGRPVERLMLAPNVGK
jgi:(2Fe-2S) ferredoxin